MRSQIARIREKTRKDGFQPGQVMLVGDRTRRRIFDELASLSRFSDELQYEAFDGEIAVGGVRVRPQ